MGNQWHVKDEDTRKRMITFFGSVPLPVGGLMVKWADFKPSKSDEQRAYFHGIVVRTMAREMGYGEAELKDVLVQMFTTPTEVTIDGKVFTVWPSTEKLNKDDYSSLIDRSIQFAAEGGVFIPPAL